MKPSQLLQLLLTAGTISTLFASPSVLASSFGEREVDDNRFAVVAAPYRHGYNLMIVEQIPGQRRCWNEVGDRPTVIEPLFLQFDFTTSCIRSADSNGYSIRHQGEDYGLDYLLDVVKRDGELHLIGSPRDSSKSELHLGSTNGFASGSLKIELKPGWHLTKRTYQGKTTQHIYLSDSPEVAEQFVSQTVPVNQTVNSQPAANAYPQQPVAYPQQQPAANAYPQQPVAYPQQQPAANAYPQQPIAYPQQQPAANAYPQQPAVNAYPQQPIAYPQQQPVAYPQQQPAANAYPQQPVAYPTTPLDINYQQQ